MRLPRSIWKWPQTVKKSTEEVASTTEEAIIDMEFHMLSTVKLVRFPMEYYSHDINFI